MIDSPSKLPSKAGSNLEGAVSASAVSVDPEIKQETNHNTASKMLPMVEDPMSAKNISKVQPSKIEKPPEGIKSRVFLEKLQ